VSLLGCEAFVRKFTRKPKKENLPAEELVLVPEIYDVSELSDEELYRLYFLLWQSWHDELINSLVPGANHKKQVSCAEEALKNLIGLKAFLSEGDKKNLVPYIDDLEDLRGSIIEDLYSNQSAENRFIAERLRRNIKREFSYDRIELP